MRGKANLDVQSALSNTRVPYSCDCGRITPQWKMFDHDAIGRIVA
jgi:hypothetical protein